MIDTIIHVIDAVALGLAMFYTIMTVLNAPHLFLLAKSFTDISVLHEEYAKRVARFQTNYDNMRSNVIMLSIFWATFWL